MYLFVPIIRHMGTFEGYVKGFVCGTDNWTMWSFSLLFVLFMCFVGVPYQLSFIPEDDA